MIPWHQYFSHHFLRHTFKSPFEFLWINCQDVSSLLNSSWKLWFWISKTVWNSTGLIAWGMLLVILEVFICRFQSARTLALGQSPGVWTLQLFQSCSSGSATINTLPAPKQAWLTSSWTQWRENSDTECHIFHCLTFGFIFCFWGWSYDVIMP